MAVTPKPKAVTRRKPKTNPELPALKKDAIQTRVLQRQNMVGRLWLMGYRVSQMSEQVSSWLYQQGQPQVTDSQLYEDLKRFREVAKDEAGITVADFVDSLQQIKRAAWADHERAGESAMVRSGSLPIVLNAEDRLMKLLGVLVETPATHVNVQIIAPGTVDAE